MHPFLGTSRLGIGWPSSLIGFGTSGTHLKDPPQLLCQDVSGGGGTWSCMPADDVGPGQMRNFVLLFGTLRTQASAFSADRRLLPTNRTGKVGGARYIGNASVPSVRAAVLPVLAGEACGRPGGPCDEPVSGRTVRAVLPGT